MPTAGPAEVIELLVLEQLFHSPQTPAPSFDRANLIHRAQQAGVPAAYYLPHVVTAIVIGMLEAGEFILVDPCRQAALAQPLQPRFNAGRGEVDLFHQHFELNQQFNAYITLLGLQRREVLVA
ncbi:MAG: hypothetical protein IT348_19770 [Candidatus Eisenbacteria bacterium]|nr:hypothetical protein [Candidatus Eisenbacteria bacterium]